MKQLKNDCIILLSTESVVASYVLLNKKFAQKLHAYVASYVLCCSHPTYYADIPTLHRSLRYLMRKY